MNPSHRLAAYVVMLAVGIFSSSVLQAQSNPPRLSRAQRATLQAIVATVDRIASAVPDAVTAEATWLAHVLRASDGSHYVALRADVPGIAVPTAPVTMYVRLAPRPAWGETAVASPRSAVMEWLRGLRGDPLPMRAARSTTVNVGEMPIGGTAASVGDVAAGATAALRLGELQRERQARQQEDENARRRAELEKPGTQRPELLPFEDFAPEIGLTAGAGPVLRIERGVTAGPGDYDVFIAWAVPDARGRSSVTVVSRRLTLPAATASFGLGDLVIADDARVLPTPYPADQQAAHPYAFGIVEVSPAADNRLVNSGTLAVMYQVVNPSGTGAGKPDVEMNFQLHRLRGERAELFGRLETQRHDAANVPGDFNVALGHPLFGVVRAPLAGFPRGRYRLDVEALDRLRGTRVRTEAVLDIKGSPESLLREAPSAGQPFQREQLLEPEVLTSLASALRPASASPELERALGDVAAGRFASLVQASLLQPSERPVAQALLALGLYGLGDSPRTIAAQLTTARSHGAPVGPIQLVLGAAFALLRDDRAAIRAWDEAREGRIPDSVVAPLLVDAYLRLGDVVRAEAMARAVLDLRWDDRPARRALASTHIASRRFSEALELLELDRPGVAEADAFLGLHALFAAHLANAPVADREARFKALAGAYLGGSGGHAELVREWLDVVAAPR